MTSIITKTTNKTSLYPPFSSGGVYYQSLVEYSNSLSKNYCEDNHISDRKTKGQIFTPPKIATFMAGLFSTDKSCQWRNESVQMWRNRIVHLNT